MKKKDIGLEATVILLAKEVKTQAGKIEKLEQNCERLREGVNTALGAIKAAGDAFGKHDQALNNLAETAKRQETIVTKHDDAMLHAGILEESVEDEKPPRVN